MEEGRKFLVNAAVEGYRNGTLTLDDVRKSEWRSHVGTFAEADPTNQDLAVLAAISEVCAQSEDFYQFVINVENDSTKIKAAQWYSKQDCEILILGVSSVTSLQALFASATPQRTFFQQLNLPMSELLKVVFDYKHVSVDFDVVEHEFTLMPHEEMPLILRISGDVNNERKNDSKEKTKKMLLDFSDNGEFYLIVTGDVFDTSLDLSGKTLRRLTIEKTILTNQHVDCLRKAGNQLTWLRLEECDFENEEAKHNFFKFVASRPFDLFLNDTRFRISGEYVESSKQAESIENLFANDIHKKDFPAASRSLGEMIRLVRASNSVALCQKLYRSYMALADLYSTSMYWGSELHKDIIFKAFFSLPPRDEESYHLAEKKVKNVLVNKIGGILLADSVSEKTTKFQSELFEDLKNMWADPSVSLGSILVWMKKFIEDSSMLPFRDNYVTNKSYKVDRLKDLYEMINPYIQNVASADPISLPRERRNSIELIDMRQLSSQPLAKLVSQQRAAESAPVLQGVSSVPAASGSQEEHSSVSAIRLANNTSS